MHGVGDKIDRYKVGEDTIECEQVFVDSIFNIPYVNKKGEVLGRALLTRQIHENMDGTWIEVIILMDIIVYDPHDRRRGIGDKLMGFITGSGKFGKVVTGLSTKAGRELCLKWGFKYIDVKVGKFLIWEEVK